MTLVTNVTWFFSVPATAKRGASADVYINGAILVFSLAPENATSHLSHLSHLIFIMFYLFYYYFYFIFLT